VQAFDPKRFPHLAALDEKVRLLLLSDKAKLWDTPRTEYEICKVHPVYWMEQYGYIRPGTIELGDSENEAEPIPFKLNPVQLLVADKICSHFLEEKYTRVQLLVLKHRKAGISTLAAAFDYWFMRFYDNIHAFAIADLSSHTDNITSMINLYQERDTCGMGCDEVSREPPGRIPMPRHKCGMKLKNGSMLEQDTGENANPGTSGTINVLHMSENSKWRDPENAETSLLNSVPRKGFVFIIKESTAYGMNKFAQDCEDAEKGKSSWEFCFITWLDMPDCESEMLLGETLTLTTEEKELMASYPKMTFGHVKFRRKQIETLGSADKFRQDFPLNSREPFLVTGSNFFNTMLVRERLDLVKFYADFKTQGLEALQQQNKYPDLLVRFKFHNRGMTEALSMLDSTCCVPKKVEFHDNGGEVTYTQNPEGRLEDGMALMFREPKRSRKYLVIVDAAEGKLRSDYVSDNAVIQVFDCMAKEQVLEWAGTFDEEITAAYAVMIAKVYNSALIAPEMNNQCGGTLWAELKKSGYTGLFFREVVRQNKITREPGWETKVSVKKDVCSQFRLDFKNGNCLLHSAALLEEMLYFMDVQGKLRAADNHLDDRVMSVAIGLKIIECTPTLTRVEKIEPEMTDLGAYVEPYRHRKQESLTRYL
jgi:hypothetical protein